MRIRQPQEAAADESLCCHCDQLGQEYCRSCVTWLHLLPDEISVQTQMARRHPRQPNRFRIISYVISVESFLKMPDQSGLQIFQALRCSFACNLVFEKPAWEEMDDETISVNGRSLFEGRAQLKSPN
jgi:hypothetical protein